MSAAFAKMDFHGVELMRWIVSSFLCDFKSIGRRRIATVRSKVTHVERVAAQGPVSMRPYFYGMYFVSSKTVDPSNDAAGVFSLQRGHRPHHIDLLLAGDWPSEVECDGSRNDRIQPVSSRGRLGLYRSKPSRAIRSTPDIRISAGTTCSLRARRPAD